MADVDCTLSKGLEEIKDKISFLHDLWGIDVDEEDIAQYASYFRWLTYQIQKYHAEEDDSEDEPGAHRLIISTYGGLIRLVNFIKKRTNVRRALIAEEMGSPSRPAEFANCPRHIKINCPDAESAMKAVELAVKAWTMMALNDSSPGEPPYAWLEDESLNDTLTKYLPAPQTSPNKLARVPFRRYTSPFGRKDEINGGDDYEADALVTPPDLDSIDQDREFSGFFTFRDMNHFCGFKIRWTNNFLSHLRVRKVRERGFTVTVFVFHHATVLPAIAKSGLKAQRAYANEAVATLGLLIPTEPECIDWFKRCSGEGIDENAGYQLESSRFVHAFCMWRCRLLRIEQEFDNWKPKNLRQMWMDLREPRMWCLEIGIVVTLTLISLMLSLISSVAGVISAQEAIAEGGK